ncbi:unnamed protein product [Cuscuta epithymum]|uniref:BED-type domain-containing protein n=1 Tax=Cuscuta epithymum TaxID=186058 RepID=A0AAV0DJL8_9ASTE|nr:unnamed protein product [Cuscuta epithymum]
MESQSSHSLPTPSESPEMIDSETREAATSRKRARNKSAALKPPVSEPRSIFWNHCVKGSRTLLDGTIQPIGTCKYCQTQIPASHGSTSGLKNHLEKRCKLSPLYKASENDKNQPVLTNVTMGQVSELVSHTFNQKRCELKLTEYVIIDEMSFRAVEGKGFVSLVHELQPRFRIPDRKKVAGTYFQFEVCLREWGIEKDIFAIPSSTVASESAFSLGKRVVDPFRSSLSPKMVEALVCTNDWLRAEDFSFYKDPTDDDLALYKEIEEIEKNANATQEHSQTSSQA